MKAFRPGADSNEKEPSIIDTLCRPVERETGLDLSAIREATGYLPNLGTTPLLDHLFGRSDDTESSTSDSGSSTWEQYFSTFSPTVGQEQAEAYRNATDEEVNAMDPALVREQLLAEQAAKDSESWVQPGGPRDLLDVAKERQAAEAMRHQPSGLQDGGHAWKLLEYAPKGDYEDDIREARTSGRNISGGYKYMYDSEGNETGWTNCSTFTTDQVMADAGYNIDKRMTIEGQTASLSDFANNRKFDGQEDYELRTLQGDLETPIFANDAEYYAARRRDSKLTHGLAGALVHATDEHGVPLGTYLPNKEGDAPGEHTKSDLNFIRPGDALQTYQGNAGHSVIVSRVVLVNEQGEELVLDGSEDETVEVLEGWTVKELSYLSANASNEKGQVLNDKTKSVDEMYAEYDGLIAARPRYNDWGEIGFEEGEDGQMHEVVVDQDTLETVGAERDANNSPSNP